MSTKTLEVVGRGSEWQKVYPNYIPTEDVPNFCRQFLVAATVGSCCHSVTPSTKDKFRNISET